MFSMNVSRFAAARRPDSEQAISLRQRRAWYDGDGTGAATDTAPDKGGDKDSATKDETKFSQEDVNRLVGQARKDGRSTATADLLKELGLDSPDALKQLVTAAKAKDDADKTAAQKADDARLKAEKERDQFKADLETAKTERLRDKRDSAILAAATKAGAIDARDVLRWANEESADALKAALKDDGAVDDKAVETLVTAAKKAKAHFFAAAGAGSPSQAGGRAAGQDSKTKREGVFGNKSSVHL